MDQDYENFVERMGSFDMNMDSISLEKNQNELKHYGILGMKWGIRRTPEQISRTKGHVDSASGIVKEAKNINNSVKNIRSSSRNKDLSSMSDKELREKVQRMNMEQQYYMLSKNKITKGQEYVNNILDVAGSALAITSSALGIALAIKQLKK
jgi:hypothetical protein